MAMAVDTYYLGGGGQKANPKTGKIMGGTSAKTTINAGIGASYSKPKAAASSSTSGSSSNRSTPSISSSKDDIVSYFEQRNNDALNSTLSAIEARLNTIKGQYNNAIKETDAEYQKLINQSEVSRYRSKGAIREALANRGQLNSGYGRQEQLSQDVKYGNAVSNLLAERQKARNDYNSLINQAIAEAEADKASAKDQFANALMQYKLSL